MKCVEKTIERVESLDDGSKIVTRKTMRPEEDGAALEAHEDADETAPSESELALELVRRRFDHHPPPNDETIDLHEWIRGKLGEFAYDLMEELPPCRERELAIRYLETAMMWANAAVAREISRRHWQEEDEG